MQDVHMQVRVSPSGHTVTCPFFNLGTIPCLHTSYSSISSASDPNDGGDGKRLTSFAAAGKCLSDDRPVDFTRLTSVDRGTLGWESSPERPL